MTYVSHPANESLQGPRATTQKIGLTLPGRGERKDIRKQSGVHGSIYPPLPNHTSHICAQDGERGSFVPHLYREVMNTKATPKKSSNLANIEREVVTDNSSAGHGTTHQRLYHCLLNIKWTFASCWNPKCPHTFDKYMFSVVIFNNAARRS